MSDAVLYWNEPRDAYFALLQEIFEEVRVIGADGRPAGGVAGGRGVGEGSGAVTADESPCGVPLRRPSPAIRQGGCGGACPSPRIALPSRGPMLRPTGFHRVTQRSCDSTENVLKSRP